MEEETSEGEWISSGFSVINMCGSSDRPSFTTVTQESKIVSVIHIWTTNESVTVMLMQSLLSTVTKRICTIIHLSSIFYHFTVSLNGDHSWGWSLCQLFLCERQGTSLSLQLTAALIYRHKQPFCKYRFANSPSRRCISTTVPTTALQCCPNLHHQNGKSLCLSYSDLFVVFSFFTFIILYFLKILYTI